MSLERMNVHLRGKADMALTDFFVRLSPKIIQAIIERMGAIIGTLLSALG
jgi:hypothetical protein